MLNYLKVVYNVGAVMNIRFKKKLLVVGIGEKKVKTDTG